MSNTRLYNEDNFKEKINDEIRCSICLDVVYQPAGNENCQHVYCKDCITHISHEKNMCPQCNSTLKIHLNKYFEALYIINLKYHCLNKNCNESFVVGFNCKNIIEHQNNCIYKLIDCPECSSPIVRNDIDNHLTTIDCHKNTIVKLKKEIELLKKEKQNINSNTVYIGNSNITGNITTLSNNTILSNNNTTSYANWGMGVNLGVNYGVNY